MVPLRRTHHLSVRTRCLISLAAVLLTGLAAPPASAQSGIIAFRDYCDRRGLYAMRGDGSGRIALPLPPLPQPTAEHQHREPLILDVTTSGPLNPLTVVYSVAIYRLNQTQSTLVDFGLFAVQVDDVGGVLRPDPGAPVRLTLPSDIGIAGLNPNLARIGAFSSTGDSNRPDRLALVAQSHTAWVLMTVTVDRDPLTSRITGLSDPIVVVPDLSALGSPDPGVSSAGGGSIDYAPDGRSIVAYSNHGLWLLHLDAANQLLESEPLTANGDGVAEWNPSYSPDGTRVAYTAGPVTTSGGVQDPNIYSLTLATGAVTRVTTKKNKGQAASSRNNAMWRADGTAIGFSAFTSGTPRRSPCSTFVNSDLFVINADGSNSAAQITNTNGTSVEAWPKWGW